MKTDTPTSLSSYLSGYDERWIVRGEGALTQTVRRDALTQARENLGNMPPDSAWLMKHLQGIETDLSNSQPQETMIRLRLTAYGIISHLITTHGAQILSRIQSASLTETYQLAVKKALIP